MTLIVGLHLEKYVLIGADTRVSYYPDNQFFFRDDEEKIRTTSIGLVTGAGLCDLLDPVNQRFADEAPADTYAMQRVIKEECQNAATRFAGCQDERVQGSLKTTGWMLTYHTNSTQYCPAGLRLCVMGTDDELERFRLAPSLTVALLPFSEITQEQFDELQQALTTGIRAWRHAAESFEANLTHHIRLIASTIYRASQMSEGVAPTFQIGVHTDGFEIAIANIFNPADPDAPFTLNWRQPPSQ